MTTDRKETMAPRKQEPETSTMEPHVLQRVVLDDNREVRISRIPTGFGEHLIRIGINTLPDQYNMSGAVFPESKLDSVIDALEGARNA